MRMLSPLAVSAPLALEDLAPQDQVVGFLQDQVVVALQGQVPKLER